MCDIIEPNIFVEHRSVRAGMSTRYGGISPGPLGMNLSYNVGDDEENVRVNRQKFFSRFSHRDEMTAYAGQCHSDRIRIVTEPGLHPDCDGFMTRTQGLGLAISVADCVPVLLFDPIKGVIAAVHAGWRGSSSSIVSKACRMMNETYGSDMEVVRAYIGPAAGPCCYEVGPEVSGYFREEVRHARNNAVTLDLKTENKIQLLGSGVKEDNIEMDPRCTICTHELFHSYRREGDTSGRMLAFISLNGER